jgi:hypothetical protein
MCEIDSKSNKKNKDLIKKFKNIQGQKEDLRIYHQLIVGSLQRKENNGCR